MGGKNNYPLRIGAYRSQLDPMDREWGGDLEQPVLPQPTPRSSSLSASGDRHLFPSQLLVLANESSKLPF